MRDKRGRRRAFRIAAAVAATLSVITGTAFATGLASTGDGGTINACAGPNGLLRVVDGASDCRNPERFLSWNAGGAPGPPGPQGATGPPGPPGTAALALSYPSLTFTNPAAGQYVEGGTNLGSVPCEPGKSVLGGGVRTASLNQLVNSSYPSDGSTSGATGQVGWAAVVENKGTTLQTFTVYAICATQ
jgi:hypothetical protein